MHSNNLKEMQTRHETHLKRMQRNKDKADSLTNNPNTTRSRHWHFSIFRLGGILQEYVMV